MTRKHEAREYPQSRGNLALVDERVGASQYQGSAPLSWPVAGQDIPERGFGDDSLGPSKGVIVGISLSIMLWCIIMFVPSWILWESVG